MIFNQAHGYFMLIFIIMTVVGNFYFSYFLRLIWEFLDLESERGVSVCWPNNKIIDLFSHKQKIKICATDRKEQKTIATVMMGSLNLMNKSKFQPKTILNDLKNLAFFMIRAKTDVCIGDWSMKEQGTAAAGRPPLNRRSNKLYMFIIQNSHRYFQQPSIVVCRRIEKPSGSLSRLLEQETDFKISLVSSAQYKHDVTKPSAPAHLVRVNQTMTTLLQL